MRNKKDEAAPETVVVIPASPDARLDGGALAAALTALGFEITKSTLSTKRCRGGGPPFSLWGRKPLYRWGNALSWAEERLTRPVSSTAEAAKVRAA